MQLHRRLLKGSAEGPAFEGIGGDVGGTSDTPHPPLLYPIVDMIFVHGSDAVPDKYTKVHSVWHVTS
jgi:hypothetical protein